MAFYDNLSGVMDQFQHRQGGFLTVKHGDKVNTMTISWGFAGIIWGEPYFITLVRPQRYTRELIDNAKDFTVSVPFGSMSRELTVCGTKSGREIDKSAVVGFQEPRMVESPVVAGCDAYFECVVKYFDDLKEGNMPLDVLSKMYDNDLHRLFFGQIIDAYGSDE